MKLNEILLEEKQRADQWEIEEDEYRVIRIWINDQHLIHLRNSPDEKLFYLYAKVSSLPPQPHQVKIYETLLEANLFGKQTGLAVLAIQIKSNSIILMRTFETSVTTFESYSRGFQDFMNYLVYWKEEMQRLITTLPDSHEDLLNIMSKRNQQILFI